jgi:MoaA/NifB/PqqE/SkfB family radical SAM enzyme
MVTEELLVQLDDYYHLAKELKAIAVFLQPINSVGRAKENGMKRVRDALALKKIVEIYEKEQRIEMLWLAAQKPHIFEHEVLRSLDMMNDEIAEIDTVVSSLNANS